MRALLSLLGVAALTIAGCATDCAELRAEAKPLIDEWQTCSGDEACALVSADNDCSGTFDCAVAVRASVQSEAQAKAQEIADQSRSCLTCEMADCIAMRTAVCEAGRCVAKP